MSLILNIDTAIDCAFISIAKDGEILGVMSNAEQKEHGKFLQPAIQTLLKNTSTPIHKLDAIAISAGPGSYTGLRVGMASAKGLCYALKKPLITIGSLEILALSALLKTNEDNIITSSSLLCPMIDARRMEVFTAVYNHNMETILEPHALVLDKNSFINDSKKMLNNPVYFFGNGAKKWKLICNQANASFLDILNNPLAMSKLAYKKFLQNDFSDLAYSEPLYLKDFFGNTA